MEAFLNNSSHACPSCCLSSVMATPETSPQQDNGWGTWPDVHQLAPTSSLVNQLSRPQSICQATSGAQTCVQPAWLGAGAISEATVLRFLVLDTNKSCLKWGFYGGRGTQICFEIWLEAKFGREHPGRSGLSAAGWKGARKRLGRKGHWRKRDSRQASRTCFWLQFKVPRLWFAIRRGSGLLYGPTKWSW